MCVFVEVVCLGIVHGVRLCVTQFDISGRWGIGTQYGVIRQKPSIPVAKCMKENVIGRLDYFLYYPCFFLGWIPHQVTPPPPHILVCGHLIWSHSNSTHIRLLYCDHSNKSFLLFPVNGDFLRFVRCLHYAYTSFRSILYLWDDSVNVSAILLLLFDTFWKRKPFPVAIWRTPQHTVQKNKIVDTMKYLCSFSRMLGKNQYDSKMAEMGSNDRTVDINWKIFYERETRTKLIYFCALWALEDIE